MSKIIAEDLGNARNITLLGGRLQIEGQKLALFSKDLLHEGTSYHYLRKMSSSGEFFDNVRRHYVGRGAVQVFNEAKVTYCLKYVPVLKCGEKLFALNNEDDYFVTDYFFSTPLSWKNSWDAVMLPVSDGCLDTSEIRILEIKLSYKEIAYLVPRLNMPLAEQLQVILMPIHVASITSKQWEYHAAQIALPDTVLAYDYPLFNDKIFSSMTHVVFLLAAYGACVAYAIQHADHWKEYLDRYWNCWSWLSKPINNEVFRNTLNDYVPILGWLAGMVIELILLLLMVILVVGIVPAILLAVPAIGSSIVATITVWFRRLLLWMKKWRLFNNLMAKGILSAVGPKRSRQV